MLMKMRKLVTDLRSVANQLDKKEIGQYIPSVSDSGDIRHAMKAEIIFILLDVAGSEAEPTDEQVSFLQYVLHAPINCENRQEYLRAIQNLERIRCNPLLPFFVLIDRQVDSNLAEVYLDVLSVLTITMRLHWI